MINKYSPAVAKKEPIVRRYPE